MSVGVDYQEKTVSVEDKVFLLQFWDIGRGGERFLSLIPVYLRHTHAAVVLYDVTSQSSSHLDKLSF